MPINNSEFKKMVDQFAKEFESTLQDMLVSFRSELENVIKEYPEDIKPFCRVLAYTCLYKESSNKIESITKQIKKRGRKNEN